LQAAAASALAAHVALAAHGALPSRVASASGAAWLDTAASSVPVRNSASSARIRSKRLRIARTSAPAGPFLAASAAMASRILPKEVAKGSAGEGAAILHEHNRNTTWPPCQGLFSGHLFLVVEI
jgi:hypothetical protein